MITFNENELSFNNNGTMTPIPYFANATASSLDARLDAVETALPTKMDKWDLLWTNASVTTSFPEQTITLDLTNYNYILICVANLGTGFGIAGCYNLIFGKGVLGRICGSGNTLFFRTVSLNNSGVTFSAHIEYTSYNGSSTLTDNRYLTPYKIYGIK